MWVLVQGVDEEDDGVNLSLHDATRDLHIPAKRTRREALNLQPNLLGKQVTGSAGGDQVILTESVSIEGRKCDQIGLLAIVRNDRDAGGGEKTSSNHLRFSWTVPAICVASAGPFPASALQALMPASGGPANRRHASYVSTARMARPRPAPRATPGRCAPPPATPSERLERSHGTPRAARVGRRARASPAWAAGLLTKRPLQSTSVRTHNTRPHRSWRTK